MRTGRRGKLRSLGWPTLAAGLALAIGVGDAQAAFPGANGRVAFAVEKWRLPDPCLPMPHGCEPEVFSSSIETVLPTGRGRRVLRAFPVEQGVGESGPVWSPSGRALTFEQDSRLAIIRADGTGLRQLPQLTNGDGDPTWSPDGRRLAFVGSRLCCNWLYTVRRNGTALRRVMAQEVRWPAWSTTGTIAFVNYNDRGGELCRPQGRDLHDQTRRLAAAAAVRPLLGNRPTARLVARWEQDRLRCTPAHLHHERRWPRAAAVDRQLRRQRPGVVAGRQLHRLHPRLRPLCHARQRARTTTTSRRTGPRSRPLSPLGRGERADLAAAPPLRSPARTAGTRALEEG